MKIYMPQTRGQRCVVLYFYNIMSTALNIMQKRWAAKQETHELLFSSYLPLRLLPLLPKALSSFLIARIEISPSNLSHLIVFSLDHLEVPSLINGKRKVE